MTKKNSKAALYMALYKMYYWCRCCYYY